MNWTHTIHYADGYEDSRDFKNDVEVGEYVEFVGKFREMQRIGPHGIAKIVNNESGKVVYQADGS